MGAHHRDDATRSRRGAVKAPSPVQYPTCSLAIEEDGRAFPQTTDGGRSSPGELAVARTRSVEGSSAGQPIHERSRHPRRLSQRATLRARGPQGPVDEVDGRHARKGCRRSRSGHGLGGLRQAVRSRARRCCAGLPSLARQPRSRGGCGQRGLSARSSRAFELRREAAFRPWLRAIASNYCIDQLRRRKLERKLFSQANFTEDGLADPSPDVLRCLTRTQERRDVLAAIDSLPTRYRLPLVLRFYRDLDYEVIADLLGVTRNQVGSLLFRAKQKLRERLSREIDGMDSDILGAERSPARTRP